MEAVVEFLRLILTSEQLGEIVPWLIGLWGSLVVAFKTPFGKKFLGWLTNEGKDRLGITDLGDKIDSLSGDVTDLTHYAKYHLGPNTTEPPVHQQIKELTELVTKPDN